MKLDKVKLLTRKTPFSVIQMPLVVRLYSWAMGKKWSSSIEQLFLGFPIYIIYYLIQNFWPSSITGLFNLSSRNTTMPIKFNAKNTQFDAIYKSDLQNGYEPEVRALLDLFAPYVNNFFDIGSNWGYFSLYLASNSKFKGSVHAFEPFPSSYDDLNKIVVQSNLKKIINTYQLAISDQVANNQMKFQGVLHSGFAMLDDNSKPSWLDKFSPHAKVNTATLDSLDISPPTLIKIDVQYHEEAVIRGAKRIISKHKPYIIFENCLNFFNTKQTFGPLIELEKLGYRFYFPCWVDSSGKNEILMPTEADQNDYMSDTLALMPIDTSKRFTYRDQINILGCHEDKLNELFSTILH
jgi:FkbM family methyltransferase